MSKIQEAIGLLREFGDPKKWELLGGHYYRCRGKSNAKTQRWPHEIVQDTIALLENEERIFEPRPPMTEILVCHCGWYGTVDEQDDLGSQNGCCPSCGNEDLDFLNEWKQIVEVWRRKGGD